ncbi:WD repeat-containing protein 36-like [Babylonia areolata]|uniref:WD repeat-containing protein 36-like n=1 Tax=Babylonia areolata TaxID=304850 RepID=UPI003FD351B6
MSASRIFSGYRALGYVSTDVPLATRFHRKHKENYVVTSVGGSFHVYNCSKLGIVSVSDIHPDRISVLATSQRHIFTACQNTIRCFDRGRKAIHMYQGHKHNVTLLLPFGRHLISVDSGGVMLVWDVHSEGIYLTVEFDVSSFEITAAVHPCTYMNKVLLGSRQGPLQLWNVLRNKLVHTFAGWDQQVTALQQAPAVDVLAVGLADGRILVHNFKYDETIMKFTQDWGPVTAISFRTDKAPTMVTGSAAGHMAFWDLETKSLKSQTLEAHGKAVSGMQCLPNEPIMVTSSGDNSLKVWIFDQADGGVRLLRMREGHSEPPNFLRHYGNDGRSILCAGQDSRFHLFSTIHDKHNKCLGRAYFNKHTKEKRDLQKMPPVTVFAAESNRESDWDSVVAVHRGLRMATTWSTMKGTMGQFKLDSQRFHHGSQHRHTTAQAVDISPCGNYVAIGYSSGHLDVYNLQSGKHRGSFGTPVAHSSGVEGVAFDACNVLLISAGGDCTVKVWHFGSRSKARVLLKEIKLTDHICRILLHRDSNMLACQLADFTVSVLDLDTLRVVRVFRGHSNSITDMSFSGDGRWLITSSMDSTVRTWSLVHGRLIDCFTVECPVTSLSMSPTGDFLATCHVGDLGVYLWANQTLYTFVALQPLPDDYVPKTITMPATANMVTEDEESTPEDEEIVEYEQSEFKTPDQISDELVTLSLLPTSRWLNLLHLEVIKMRNKPKEPPKVPKSAPFFLPTVAGLTPTFAVPTEDKDEEAPSSRIIVPDLHAPSEFAGMLLQASESGHYKPVLARLKNQGAFAIDTDIRSLQGEEELFSFMDFILNRLQTNQDFDVLNGYLGLFLQVHRDGLQTSKELREKMQTVTTSLTQAADFLDQDMRQSLCLQKFMVSSKVG